MLNNNLNAKLPNDVKVITEGSGVNTKYYLQRGADTASKKLLGSNGCYFFPRIYSSSKDQVFTFDRNIKQAIVLSAYGLRDKSSSAAWTQNANTNEAFYKEGDLWFATNWSGMTLADSPISSNGSYTKNDNNGLNKIIVNQNTITLAIGFQPPNNLYYNYMMFIITE